MKSNSSPRSRAILLALFVTFLWSTSWVLIKFGLDDIPPLTFAGLRYFLAFLALIPAYVRSNSKTPVRELSRFDWWYLIGLGLIYYTVTQGTQFLALSFLPAITLSLLLNGTAIVVAVLGICFSFQRDGLICDSVSVDIGALLFFYPFVIPTGQTIGYLIAAVNVLATSMASIMGRGINRQARIHPLTVTLVSMGVGSIILLGSGLFVEPLPSFNLRSWAIILWLAVVNTAFAFTLWNLTLRTLSAMESSVINNTMLIQITILAWLFLGETLTWIEAIGLVLAALGALLVQVRFGNGKAGD